MKMKIDRPLAVVLPAILFLLFGILGRQGIVLASPSSPASACSALIGLKIPKTEIGLATNGALVQSALLVAASAPGNVNGEFCQVRGVIRPVDSKAPDIRFQINLPSNWNNKALQMGGGGFNGTVVTGLGPFSNQPVSVPNPLRQGYVTFGSDSGHESEIPFDGSFALNDEALANFARLQIKKTRDAAMAVVKARYASLPRYSYFIGASQGGKEALDAALRYPEDYDGIVAGYPAYNQIMMHHGSNSFAKALYANGGAGWISPAKVKLLYEAVMAACDGLDGVVDGIISNPNGEACKSLTSKFILKTQDNPLRCPGGVDTGVGCLSDPQIETVSRLNSRFNLGFMLANGLTGYGKWPILDGTDFLENPLGAKPTYSIPPDRTDAFQLRPSDATIRYFVTRNLLLDSITHYNPADWATRVVELSHLIEASSVNFDVFRAKGGKILLYHGTNDASITPYNTLDYYSRLLARHGQSVLDTFLGFYLIPGFGHGGGRFMSRTNWLEALEGWVEKGMAPGTLLAIDGNTDPATRATNGRSRPVCVYPLWPKYTGPATKTQAEVNDAANYICSR